ncbi:unnamed protein product [Linum trigynum]|uniref:Uncharacterized protein n=1 Tax=Linum trigynum TaxID=586398 RepID=A0AAV2FF16_9ROSI
MRCPPATTHDEPTSSDKKTLVARLRRRSSFCRKRQPEKVKPANPCSTFISLQTTSAFCDSQAMSACRNYGRLGAEQGGAMGAEQGSRIEADSSDV